MARSSLVLRLTIPAVACVLAGLGAAAFDQAGEDRLVRLQFSEPLSLQQVWTYQEPFKPEDSIVFWLGATSTEDDIGLAITRSSILREAGFQQLLTTGLDSRDPRVLYQGDAPQRKCAFSRIDLDGDKRDEVLMTGRGGAGGTSFLTVFKVAPDSVKVLYSDTTRHWFYLVADPKEKKYQIANPGFDFLHSADHMLVPKEYQLYTLSDGKYVHTKTLQAAELSEIRSGWQETVCSDNYDEGPTVRIVRPQTRGAMTFEQMKAAVDDLTSREERRQAAALERLQIPEDGPVRWLGKDSVRLTRLASGQRVVSVTWPNPHGGRILLYDASGELLCSHKMRTIEQVQELDIDADGIEELLVTSYASGTGLQRHMFHLLVVEGETIHEVWSDICKSREYGGWLGAREVDCELAFEFSSKDGGPTIVYSRHVRERDWNEEAQGYDKVVGSSSITERHPWSDLRRKGIKRSNELSPRSEPEGSGDGPSPEKSPRRR